MKHFLQVLAQFTRFGQSTESTSTVKSAMPDPLMLIWVHLLQGVYLSLVAGLTLWIVRHPLLSPLLATLAVSLARGYLLNWRDKLVCWRLLSQYFPALGQGARTSAEQSFQTSLMHWVLLLRPALYFFILQSGCWYWLIPISVLSAAFGYEIHSTARKTKTDWQPWLAAVIITLLALLVGKFQSIGLTFFPIGIMTCIATWLLSAWFKRLPVRPADLLSATYLGELIVCF
ncbi:MAG: hypothetical protein WCT05_11540, partial [Lentisphaeria bacterium]